MIASSLLALAYLAPVLASSENEVIESASGLGYLGSVYDLLFSVAGFGFGIIRSFVTTFPWIFTAIIIASAIFLFQYNDIIFYFVGEEQTTIGLGRNHIKNAVNFGTTKVSGHLPPAVQRIIHSRSAPLIIEDSSNVSISEDSEIRTENIDPETTVETQSGIFQKTDNHIREFLRKWIPGQKKKSQ